MSVLTAFKRCSQQWKRRMLKLEERKERVYQYAGENTKRAEHVYVWGYAGTGALGKKGICVGYCWNRGTASR
jgi:hypothetical protein